jgi:hypothetical protein
MKVSPHNANRIPILCCLRVHRDGEDLPMVHPHGSEATAPAGSPIEYDLYGDSPGSTIRS